MTNLTELPESKHFQLHELADGVYAAIAKPEGMAACNSGIIDLGDKTIVIDTFISPEAASDLRAAAEALTDREVELVLITHHHLDHIWGNQAFDEKTCIFSSEDTHRAIIETGEETLKTNKQNMTAVLSDTQQKLLKANTEAERVQLNTTLQMAKQRLALVDTVKLRLPNLTCHGPVTFHGSSRKAEFIPYEKAHSPGNAVIYLPQEGIVFVGDLLFARRHPFMGDGDPAGWQRVLGQIEALQPKQVVPGHGELSTVEEIRELAAYIDVVSRLVKDFVLAGKSADDLTQITLPEPFSSWQPQELLMRTLNGLFQFYSQN